jgi:hypothetical protein
MSIAICLQRPATQFLVFHPEAMLQGTDSPIPGHGVADMPVQTLALRGGHHE